MCLVTVLFMSIEKLGLLLYRVPNGQIIFDLKLTATLHTKVSKLERVFFSLQSFISVSSIIHQVNFSDDADGTFTFRVNLSG